MEEVELKNQPGSCLNQIVKKDTKLKPKQFTQLTILIEKYVSEFCEEGRGDRYRGKRRVRYRVLGFEGG